MPEETSDEDGMELVTMLLTFNLPHIMVPVKVTGLSSDPSLTSLAV